MRHQFRGMLMAKKRIASHYDSGNGDIVRDIAGDSSMINPLPDRYDNETLCMLITGAS
jgi:hypothetical protein